jgi:hypothetical protein
MTLNPQYSNRSAAGIDDDAQPTLDTSTEVVVPDEVVEPGNRLAVVADEQLLSAIAADDDWADVGDGDMDPESKGRIPHLILNRKLDGGFTDPETGEIVQSLDFIWLARSRSRAFWMEPFGKGSKSPDCRSHDGIVPDPESPNLQSDRCASCVHAQWVEDMPANCNASIEALTFIPDAYGEGRLARLRFGGMSVKPANDYWSTFATRVPRRPPIAFVTHAQLEPVKTPNGTFLVPKFTVAAEIPRGQANGLIAERDRRLADWQADTADDVAAGTTVADDDTGTAPTYLDASTEPF